MERYWDTRCKFYWSFMVATLLLCSSRVPATLARTHPDYLNIDCGANDTYVDPVTGYTWVPDTAYISSRSGKLYSPVVPIDLQDFTEFKVLRYFDDLRPKNCFTLPVVSGSTYLLRATFYYGNYDNKNHPPSFQVALDASVMENVTAPSGDSFTYVEYHYVAQGNESILCLLRTSPEETPFISGISLKPASALTKGYVDEYGQALQNGLVMKTGIRVNYGGTKLIRAPDDYYDRFWFPEVPNVKFYLSPTTSPKEFLSTTSLFSNLVNQDNLPPSSVMQTAVTSNGTLASVLFYPGTSNKDKKSLFVSVYFAELVRYIGTPIPRNFTINVLEASIPSNSEGIFLIYLNYDIYYTSNTVPVEANATMTMAPIAGAVNGPILNAMEVFVVSDPMMAKTIKRDALAIEDIKEKLNLTEWTGDPCLPTPHSWIGCIPPNGTTPEPQITSMNLSKYHLEGSIPSSFANLSALTSLSLENNSLTGQLPEFLTTLPKLRVLSIQNNNFSGSIPKGLLATNSPVLFTFRPGNPLLSLVAPSESSEKFPSVGAIVGATTVGILGALLILVIAIFAHRRFKCKAPSLSDDEGTRMMKIATPGAAKAYSRAEVNVATNNWNRELGRGGFGPVYYGILPDGKEVAVKVADKSSKQGEKEFFNEVDVLSRVHHKNLVALVGYCQERDSILIYEYMPNGSLFDHLHGTAGKGSTLDWKRRLHIGLNAAQGLEYLHTGCCPSFVHRDVKSGNILLTPKFDAKVADFGLTRLMGETEDTRVLTNVMGTAGYLDPEYYTTQYLHTKSDVYSFGVVLLELITGRLPIDQSMTAMGKNTHISHWVRESLQNNGMDSIVAPAVKASNPNMRAVWKVVEIAMQSVEPKASHRPSMTQVVHELQDALALEGGTFAGSEFHSGYVDNSSSFPMTR